MTNIHCTLAFLQDQDATYGQEDTKPIFSGGNKTFESIKSPAVAKRVHASLPISSNQRDSGEALTPITTIAMRSALAGTVFAILSL